MSVHNPDPARRAHGQLVCRLILEPVFSNRCREPNNVLAVYQQHIERGIELVPEERLLHYRITEGWQPLARFLEVEVPGNKFPWLNERNGFLAAEPEWAKDVRRRQSGDAEELLDE